MPQSRISTMGRGRPAFTLVELLTAVTMTALVAAAGTTLVFAVDNTVSTTKQVRDTKTAGHYALARIADTIRAARAIGQVTPTSITLWLTDRNNDDLLNANELGGIWYDATAKTITFISLPGSTDTTVINVTDFANQASVATLLTGTGRQSIVWGERVESLAFLGYPDNTNTRIVDTGFTIGTGINAVSFRISASPRASADYLFKSTAKATPLTGSTRVRRLTISNFNGLDAAAMPVPTAQPN
jgi:hypothetical protein